MHTRQHGIGLGGLLMGSVIVIAVLLLGMKLAPSYIEFFAIKKAIHAIGEEKRGGASVAEVRKSFDQRATVDDINTIKGSDLEVTKEGSEIVIRAAYRKEIKLFGNIGLFIDFSAASKE